MEIANVFGRSRSLITDEAKALKSKGLINYSPGEIKMLLPVGYNPKNIFSVTFKS
jgi:hypothetical protein